MISLIHSVIDVAAITIIVRLLTFRGSGCRHRPLVALAAWGLSALCACVMFYRAVPEPLSILLAMVLTVLAISLIKTSGNVAHLVPRRRRSQ